MESLRETQQVRTNGSDRPASYTVDAAVGASWKMDAMKIGKENGGNPPGALPRAIGMLASATIRCTGPT